MKPITTSFRPTQIEEDMLEKAIQLVNDASYTLGENFHYHANRLQVTGRAMVRQLEEMRASWVWVWNRQHTVCKRVNLDTIRSGIELKHYLPVESICNSEPCYVPTR